MIRGLFTDFFLFFSLLDEFFFVQARLKPTQEHTRNLPTFRCQAGSRVGSRFVCYFSRLCNNYSFWIVTLKYLFYLLDRPSDPWLLKIKWEGIYNKIASTHHFVVEMILCLKTRQTDMIRLILTYTCNYTHSRQILNFTNGTWSPRQK